MDQLLAQINVIAAAHPFLFAGLTFVGGMLAKHYLFTAERARQLVKWYFSAQRSKLKKLGLSQAQIKEAMKEEADFVMSVAQEAEAEAEAEPATAEAEAPAKP